MKMENSLHKLSNRSRFILGILLGWLCSIFTLFLNLCLFDLLLGVLLAIIIHLIYTPIHEFFHEELTPK
ncbi:hypothetical protein MOTE_10170 [Moorella thermoacetica]|uniref:Uncharacterized protein n=1 Tax=Neomoorella thermoacetica TaxID=1525 RepID=A0A1J5NKV9_NEOTH|nr:hypothetical protein MOTE_10170 [Moorella thermoacetica]